MALRFIAFTLVIIIAWESVYMHEMQTEMLDVVFMWLTDRYVTNSIGEAVSNAPGAHVRNTVVVYGVVHVR